MARNVGLGAMEFGRKEADKRRLVKYRCPCSMCAGGKVLSRATIRKHLRRYKRDSAFTKSILVSDIFAFVELYCITHRGIEHWCNIDSIRVGTKTTFC